LKHLEDHPSVGEVRGTGLWLAIDFTIDKKTRAPYPTANLMNLLVAGQEKGVITKTMGLPRIRPAPDHREGGDRFRPQGDR